MDLVLVVLGAVLVALTTAMFAGTWAIFEKADRSGWATFVPLYNLIVLHQVAGRPGWWVLFYICCPGINTILLIMMYSSLCERFGKGFVYRMGLFFLPFLFFPLLGFGGARYQHPGLERAA